MSVVGIAMKSLEFVYAICQYHEDFINVSAIKSRIGWK